MTEEVKDSDLEDRNAEYSPRKTPTLFSCRLEDWAYPNARLIFRKKYLHKFFQTVFFLDIHCFSFRLEANETLSYMGRCACDLATPDRLFFYLSHAILEPGKDTED